MRSTWWPWIAGAGLMSTVSLGLAQGGTERGAVLDITVDATTGTDGLDVRLVAEGLRTDRPFWFKRVADPGAYRFGPIEVTRSDGSAVPTEQKGALTMVDSPAETLVATYHVRPGGDGRHGLQGLVTDTWAGLDGRVALAPRGLQGFHDIRWHFELPEGWRVASGLQEQGDGSWGLPGLSPAERASVMGSLCMGLGPFDEDVRRVGEAEVRVFTHRAFPDGAELADKAHGVIGWFHRALGFEPAAGFALVWTPPGPKMAKVWSGSGAVASCYERPQGGFHNWELLGHRIAHPLNEYAPAGFTIRDAADQWFMEGWATYVEKLALQGGGVLPDQHRWNGMYETYREALATHPEWGEFPLSREPEAKGELTEHLHYVRGPLTVRALAEVVKRRSDTDLEQFMRHVFQTHGGFQRPLALRDELAAFTGASLDDFWATMVDQASPIVPVWPEYEQAVPAVRPGPSLRAGSVGWSADQLHGLLRSNRFAGATGLLEALQETGRMHTELKRRDALVLPAGLRPLRTALSPDVRADLDTLVRQWQLEGAPAVPSGGCGGAVPAVARPDLDPVDEVGTLVLALADTERSARRSGARGLVRLRLSVDGDRQPRPASAAAIRRKEGLTVAMDWVKPPEGVWVRVVRDEGPVAERWHEIEPGWTRTWMSFPAADLGEAVGLLRVQVVDQGEVLGERGMWRR